MQIKRGKRSAECLVHSMNIQQQWCLFLPELLSQSWGTTLEIN